MTIKTRFLLLPLAVLLSGCSADEAGQPEPVYRGTVSGISLETLSPTRTTVEYDAAENVIHSAWADGDAVLLSDLVSSASFSLMEGEAGKTTARFSGTLPVAEGQETLLAAYPASKSRLDGGAVKITLNSGQSAANRAENDLKGVSVAAEEALSGEVRLTMENLTAILKVKLTLPETLCGYNLAGETLHTLSLESSLPISGEGTLGQQNGAMSLTGCSGNQISYEFPSGTPAASANEAMLFIAPGDYGDAAEEVIWTAQTEHYAIRFRFSPGMALEAGYFYSATFNLSKSSWTPAATLAQNRDYRVEITGIDPGENNVFGQVRDIQGQPLAGVVVSDGYAVTTTGDDGVYRFQSEKANGYVFISQPQGYETTLDGVFPEFWQALDSDISLKERHDFTLTPVSNDDCVLLTLGDFHLCNRNALSDLRQFRMQVGELKQTVQALQAQGKRVYGLTLGDMTWDIYWDGSEGLAGCFFDLPAYRSEVNADFAGLDFPIWHTIGNHDHDYREEGDWDTVIPYKQTLGPTYYSFNAGGYHIISLDNVICKNTGRNKAGRNDDPGLTDDILAWLRSDIALVPAGMPVIVSMHEPAYTPTNPDGEYKTATYASSLTSALGSRNIHIVTGHTHNVSNVAVSNSIYEHNTGALCSTWWWTGRYSITSEASWGGGTSLQDTYHIGRDGSPAGYTIYNLSSGTMNWKYKAFGLSGNRQFKTYDRNMFTLTAANWCPSATEARKKQFETLAAKQPDYSYAKAAGERVGGVLSEKVPNNMVYINVWNWDSSWTITVKEGSKNLPVTKLTGSYDPMHLVAYPATRLQTAATTSTFVTVPNQHMFRVTASSANSTLTITVTDRFGNVYTESMMRPKTFDVNWE